VSNKIYRMAAASVVIGDGNMPDDRIVGGVAERVKVSY